MNTFPATRRVAIASGPGEPGEVIAIETEPLSQPGSGEVVVRVDAAAINHAENLALAGGHYARMVAFPQRLGYEGAGIVVGAGPNTTTPTGTRVAFLAFGTGGCAEHVTVTEPFTVPLPDELDTRHAAGILSAGLTAQLLSRVREVSSAAVWGAAGPVGRMLTGFLAESGATVVGIASTGRTADLTAIGATSVVDRRQSDVATAVRDSTDGRGVDVVFDPVGAPVYPASLAMLRVGGLYVNFGQVSGELPTVDMMELMETGVQVTKFGGAAALPDGIGAIPALLSATVDLAVRRPATMGEPGGVFALDRVADAYRTLAGGASGKVLVVP